MGYYFSYHTGQHEVWAYVGDFGVNVNLSSREFFDITLAWRDYRLTLSLVWAAWGRQRSVCLYAW
jgi:hypothetical protein